MEFIEDPFLMWKTGDLEQQRLVLRMVFAEPLVYDAETGFYTATLSLPLKVSCIPELDRLEVVEMPLLRSLSPSAPASYGGQAGSPKHSATRYSPKHA